MSNHVEMILWDVQHGNATYIRTPNGKHIVIDLGLGDYSGKNQKFSPLAELRHKYGVQQLDLVVITHPHRDHIDDILNFDHFNPKSLHTPKSISDDQVMENVQDNDKPKFEKYCEIRRRYNGDITGSPNDIRVPANYGGVKVNYFATSDLPTDNFNNHSLVYVIEYAGIKVVLPGDNECASLARLMDRQDFKDAVRNADILLAPHHGRESAFHDEFVSHVNPRLTVISDGSICDTSANPKYSQKSRGWSVYKSGEAKQRYLLTTNCDGEVYVKFGANGNGNFLNVSIN